jgi:hypothetical protein
MDILELIEDREQTVAASISRPFCCPEGGCSKVGCFPYLTFSSGITLAFARLPQD